MEERINKDLKFAFLVPVFKKINQATVLFSLIKKIPSFKTEILASFENIEDFLKYIRTREDLIDCAVVNRERKFFSKNINQLADLSRADYLVVSNQDVYFKPESISLFFEEIIKNNVLIASPIIKDPEGNLSSVGLMWNKEDKNWFKVINWLTGKEEESQDNFIPRPILPFTFIVIKKDFFFQMGKLDPDIFFSFEDVDFCLRALEKGQTPKLFKKAAVYHIGGETMENANKKDFILKSQAAFWKKWDYNKVSRLILEKYYEKNPLDKRLYLG